MRSLAIVLGVLLAGCVSGSGEPAEDLQSQLINSRLLFPAEFPGSETLVFELRDNGTGRVIETIGDQLRGDETMQWRIQDGELCMTPQTGSVLSTSGREECVEVTIEGEVVLVGSQTSPRLVGTIAPL